MDTKPLPKKLSVRAKILLGIAAIAIIVAALLIVYPDVINESNNNQQIVIDNNNTGNVNTATVQNDINNSNDTNQAAANNQNAAQVVMTNQANTNQIADDSDTNTNQAVNQQIVVTTAITIDDTATQLVPKQTGYCEALAPADWSFVTNAESTGADLFSPDRSQHAGWGISAVYNYMYPDVDSFLTAWLSYAFTGSFESSGFTLGKTQNIYEGFIQRDFTTSTGRKGMIIYKTYNYDDPTMYVVSVYMADTVNKQWESNGALPFSAAISIRCVSQMRPTTSSVNVSTSDPSNSSDNPEVSLSDRWTEAIMGYENVYSPTTGDHYEAPLTSQWDTGPEGAGYYRSLPGGGYEKLERGFGSY
ncbi:hypothetical protein KKF61_05775 [Patescibacteria group bacterium]|nr:hypothetical protein [Patescibacteria group bacterium]MBU0964611.1 hypothetical protein [Patescibacteria group bacterium]